MTLTPDPKEIEQALRNSAVPGPQGEQLIEVVRQTVNDLEALTDRLQSYIDNWEG